MLSSICPTCRPDGRRAAYPIAASCGVCAAFFRSKVIKQESRYQRAIALNPDNFSAYIKLAQLYEGQLDYESALKTYQLAAKVGIGKDQQKAEAGIVRALIYKQDLDGAENRLEKSLESQTQISGDQYEVLKQLGQAYLEKGRAKQNEVEQLRRYLGQNQSALTQSDQVLGSNDDLVAAGKWFSKGRELSDLKNPQINYEMLTYLAWTYWEQNDWIRAETIAREAVSRQKKTPDQEKYALPDCIIANARIHQSGEPVKLLIEVSKNWYACTGSKTITGSEFDAITQQLKQLNQPFQPE